MAAPAPACTLDVETAATETVTPNDSDASTEKIKEGVADSARPAAPKAFETKKKTVLHRSFWEVYGWMGSISASLFYHCMNGML